MYSKKRDQQGPLRGNISPLPRTSRGIPGSAGIMSHDQLRAMRVGSSVEGLLSQRSMPVSRKEMAPMSAPIMTMG